MSVEIQGTPQTYGSLAAVEDPETATVSVEAEGVESTGNDKEKETATVRMGVISTGYGSNRATVRMGVLSTGNDEERVGCSCFLFINAIIQIVIGGYFHHDCPAQPYIPIYLEVLGAVTMVFFVWTGPRNDILATILNLVQIFCFCFIMTGGVWIYSIFPPNYNSDIMPYCNKILYLFAFIDTTIIFVLDGLNILCCCCCCIVWKFVSTESE